MSKKLMVLSFSILLLMGVSMTDAFGAPIYFTDTTIQWTPEFGNNPGLDVYGTPDIEDGWVHVNSDNSLNSVTINMKSTSRYWYLIEPGSLWINQDDNDTWDWIVDTVAYTPDASDAAGDYSLYSISQPFDNAATNSNYLFSFNPRPASWRNGAPVGMTDTHMEDEATDMGWAHWSGWAPNVVKGDYFSVTYSNFTAPIYLDEHFTIAWSPTCGNDILKETLWHEVPEPSAMLLVGSGLIGLLGVARKIRKK